MTSWTLHPVQQPGRDVARVIRPGRLLDALAALRDHPLARPVAGGTDLLLDLERGGPGEAVTLVDLTGVPELQGIVVTDESVTIGAGVTHNDVVGHRELRRVGLPLAQACLEVGSPQLRNRATIAGNLVTASPANDTISALLALDATVIIASLDGGAVTERAVAIDDFFTGFRTTVLSPGELVTGISFTPLDPSAGAIWAKLGNRRAQAISVVHLGIVLERDAEGVVTDARVALGSVAERVVLVPDAAAALVGTTLDDDAIVAAATAATTAVTPIDDVRATAAYRTATIPAMMERALRAIRGGQAAAAWPPGPPCLGTRSELAAGTGRVIDDVSEITVTVNGTECRAAGAASATLLDWLREECGLPGTKEGCAEGECGACTVHLDGRAVMSCLVPAGQADGGTVTTVEGLGGSNEPHPLQQAFVDEFAVQCGYCIPGFIMAGAALLDEVEDPTDDQIRFGLAGNLCRCTGYYPMIQAVHTAAWGTDEERGS